MRDSEWNGLSGGIDELQMDSEPEYIGMVDDDDDDPGGWEEDDFEEEAPQTGDQGPADQRDPDREVVATIRAPGSYVTLNAEAFNNARSQPMRVIEGKPTRKIGPNVYAVMAPSRQRPNMGMGMGQSKTSGGKTGSVSGSIDIGGIIQSGVGALSQISQSALQWRQSEVQMRAEAEARRIAARENAAARQDERDASRREFEARQAESQRQFQIQLAQIQAEREAMMRTQGMTAAQAAAALPDPLPPPVLPPPSEEKPEGMPGWAWALIAVGGVVVVGGVVYAVSKK